MRLHEIVKQARQARAMTQNDLATAAGLSQSQLSSFESGRSGLSIDVLERVMCELGITLTVEAFGARVEHRVEAEVVACA